MVSACVLLTGEVASGKSTRLSEWARGQRAVSGVLQLSEGGARALVDLQTGERRPLDADEAEGDSLLVGRYRFRRAVFEWASKLLRAAPAGWVIVDEVGPLELRGEGLDAAIRELRGRPDCSLILVVRTGLVPAVIARYGLQDPVVLTTDTLPHIEQRATSAP